MIGLAVALAVAVAASRVLLDLHWLSDVIGGLALGWGWFALCAVAFGGRLLDSDRRGRHRRRRGGVPEARACGTVVRSDESEEEQAGWRQFRPPSACSTASSRRSRWSTRAELAADSEQPLPSESGSVRSSPPSSTSCS